ncbi:hypothetical protein R5R35_013203 [Gryllus longicercus]|uniref:Uncharacterized protein n=1 Tax=Gryllus longicercus TaxID=2509291 RepID=A0AAN9WTA9_9ORTH
MDMQTEGQLQTSSGSSASNALARGASHRHVELTALAPSSPTACCYTSSRDAK